MRIQTFLSTGLMAAGLAMMPVFGAGIIGADMNKAMAQNAQAVAGRVLVEGNRRIESETIRSYMTFRAGDIVSGKSVNNSLKALFATGLFKDVKIGIEGQDVVVTVEENPVINQIAFEGNDALEDTELEPETSLRPRTVVTRKKVQSAVERLQQIYRRSGRFAANIEPKIIELSDNRVDLVFEIDEGEVTGVRSIKFVGNKAFSDGDLKDEIATVETRWFRFLSNTDRYDPDRLAFDRELLRTFYRNRGYAEFQVTNSVAELSKDKKEFYVTFSVDEGERFTFGDVAIESDIPDLDTSKFQSEVQTLTGDRFDADDMEDTVQALTDAVGTQGYAFTNVRADTIINQEDRTVDVVYHVNEGDKVYVERIDIVNNFRTHDEVVRREFRLVEGDAYNTAKIRRSIDRIRGLGFFKQVNAKQERGSAPDKTVLTVEVEEQSTGSVSLGAGLSSDTGVAGTFGLSEKNFMGRGYNVTFKAELSGESAKYNISMTDPWFLDRELSAGFDLFNTETESDTFTQSRLGGALRAGYPWSKDIFHTIRYTLVDQTVDDVDAGASRAIREQEGSFITSSISHSFIYSDVETTGAFRHGQRASISQTFAGLGGDDHFVKHDLSASLFHKLDDYDVMFSLGTDIGYIFGIGEDIRLANRYSLGGRGFLGFEPSGVGPRATDGTEDALGGNLSYVTKAEVKFPLGMPDELQIYGRLFNNAGSLTEIDQGDLSASDFIDDGSIRAAAGFGISWTSPMGPITLDFSYPYLKADEDKEEVFNFGFGTTF